MKKLLLPIMISSILISSVANAATEQEVKDIINKNEKTLFTDQKAKEWGDTPDFVRLLTSRINVKNKSEGLSPFNIFWLEKVNEDPKTYQLSSQDQKWISDKISQAKDNKSSFWYPNGLSIVETPVSVKEIVVNPEPEVKSEDLTEHKDATPVHVKENTDVKNSSSELNPGKNTDSTKDLVIVEKEKPNVVENIKDNQSPPVVSKSENNSVKELSWGETANPTQANDGKNDVVNTKENTSLVKDIPSPVLKEVEPPKLVKKETENNKSENKSMKKTELPVSKPTSSLPLEKATVSKNKSDFSKKENKVKEEQKVDIVPKTNNTLVKENINVEMPAENKELNTLWYISVMLKLIVLSFISAMSYSLISRKKVKNK